MSEFKEAIAKQISELSGVPEKSIIEMIEIPKDLSHGDLAIPVPKFNKFKKLTEKPNDVAAKWAAAFQPNDLIENANPTGAFINFRINKSLQTAKVLKDVWDKQEKYGTCDIGQGKTVVVEFSSPNIAKPFHAGHLRSTIIGNFIAHIYAAIGYKTIAINYLGDWGKQYGLLAVGFERFGSEEELQKNPIKHLYDIYVKINAEAEKEPTIHDEARSYFKKMEDGDEEALKVWKRFRDMSIGEYEKIYARLNVQFDVYSGESLQSERMKVELEKLTSMNLLEDSQGAKIVNLEPFKLGKALVVKKDGTTLYITRDIAAAASRAEKYQFDKMFYVVAAQQNFHFQQLFKVLEMMKYDFADKVTHINFGMVKGMSTRKGTVVFLEDILHEAANQMQEVMQKNEKKYAEIENPLEVADIVGLSAVVIQDLSARRVKDYDFNWARMTSFEGDTGPYLQYAHARLCSIQRKALAAGLVLDGSTADFSLIKEKEGHQLATIISKYGDTLVAASNQLEPCVLVNYLFDLSHAISSCHEKLWVLGDQEKKTAEARLALYWAARIVLGSGLKILGLKPLERM